LPLPLAEDEQAALRASAQIVRKAIGDLACVPSQQAST
jgi:hypothetical protein